jgi:hypothetical protein
MEQTAMLDLQRRWEARPTLRLASPDFSGGDVPWDLLERIADDIRHQPGVAAANVGLEQSEMSQGITATIALARPSPPGAAADEAIRLLAEASAHAGLICDALKEVVVEMADVDPRSL